MNDLLALAGWLCGSVERRRLLRVLLRKKGESRVSQLAREANVSKALASAFVAEAVNAKLISRHRNGFFLRNDFFAKELRRLDNFSRLNLTPLKALSPKTIVLYGSWADGSNSLESDVDICVVVKKSVSESAVAVVSGEMSRKLGVEVSLLVLDGEKLASLKKNSRDFYFALAYKSILLGGAPLEA